MKLRVKLDKASRVIDLGQNDVNTATLADLKREVITQFQLDNQEFQLSLNKRDPLTGDTQVLSDFGLVAGDLLHIIGDNIQVQQPQTSELSLSPSPNDDQMSASPSSSGQAREMAQDEYAFATEEECEMDDFEEEFMRGNPQSIDPDVNRYLQEPLLVRESTATQVPVLLQQLYTSAGCTSNNEALWVLLHTVMLESGFLPSESQDPTIMPKDWRRSGFYSCTYTFQVSPDTVGNCSLVAVPIGSSVAVHALNTTDNAVFKTDHLQLKSSDFVRSLTTNVPDNYRALDRLSRQFNDVICLPIINDICTTAGFPQRQGLLALPFEIKQRVMSFLDASGVCQLGQTCQDFNSIRKDKTVWRILYLRRFGKLDDCSLSRDWYQLYKDRHIMVREEQARRRRILYMDDDDNFRPFPDFNPMHPTNPFRPFPHMLGGEHDLNPEYAAGLPNPLGRHPGGLRLPNPGLSDPFAPGMGGLGMPGRPSGRGNMTGSPFSTPFGRFI